MASKKISELDSKDTITGTEELEINDSGVSKKVVASLLKGNGNGIIVKTQTGQLTDSVYQTISFPAVVTRDTVISYFIAIERTDAQNVNYWATSHNNHDGQTFTAYLTITGLKFNIVSNIHAKQYKIVYLILA